MQQRAVMPEDVEAGHEAGRTALPPIQAPKGGHGPGPECQGTLAWTDLRVVGPPSDVQATGRRRGLGELLQPPKKALTLQLRNASSPMQQPRSIAAKCWLGLARASISCSRAHS